MVFDITLRNPGGFNILLNDYTPPAESGPVVKMRGIYALGNIYKFRR